MPDIYPVTFRAERSGPHKGEVTAVFPDGVCYCHIGQHSSYEAEWYHSTRPATPEEYADLLAELRSIYETGHDAVKLRVYKRRQF